VITEIGPHRVKCGNILDGIDDLMSNNVVDIVYSDPPWLQSHMKYWETIRLRHNPTEVRRDNQLEPFLDMFFKIAITYSTNLVFVEYALKGEFLINTHAEKAGLYRQALIVTLYKSGSKLLPMHLHVFTKRPITLPEGYIESVSLTSGIDTVMNAIKPFIVPRGTILDHCCGLGTTARAALKTGMVFRGNEINPKRLQKTIEVLNARKKNTPQRDSPSSSP
jgi:hypothetical protein